MTANLLAVEAVRAHGRWTADRKAKLVAAIHLGEITVTEACARYDLSVEEVWSSRRRDAAFGKPGLSVGRMQEFRHG